MRILSALLLVSLFTSLALALLPDPPSYDYIVVGAGPGGCACAARLVANGYSVLLIEQGVDDAANPLDKLAPRLTFNQWKKSATADRWFSEKDVLGNRKEFLTGRGPGGTTLINAGLYTRPADADFDNWGMDGWDATTVNEWFDEIEQVLNIDNPLTEQSHTDDVLNAFLASDFLENDSLDGSTATNNVFKNKLIRMPNGFRLDAFTAYIQPLLAANNPLFTYRDNSQVVKLHFREGESFTNEVFAIKAFSQGTPNKSWLAFAKREVILAAGPYGTPKLLQLSGVGDLADLQELGIPQRVDLPQVGKNAIVRPLGLLAYSGTNLLVEQFPFNEFSESEIDSFQAGLGGFFATPVDAVIGYGNPAADPIPAYMLQFTTTQPFFEFPIPTALGFACVLSHPLSRGSVRASSSNPFDPATVTTGMFTDPTSTDLINMVECLKKGREVASQISPAILGTEILPGAGVSDAALGEYVMASHRFSYHTFGTCRMGNDETDSVTDKDLKVHKFSNLRIVDSSVFPSSISSGPMSTTYMIGHRTGDTIAGSSSPIDPNTGYNVCHEGSVYIIMDPIPSTEIVAACNSIGRVPFTTNDKDLTCTAWEVIGAMGACDLFGEGGVGDRAFLKPRGFVCDVLKTFPDYELHQDAGCDTPLPVICVNGVF